MTDLLLRNAAVLDIHEGVLRSGQDVLVSGDRITAVGPTGLPPSGATVVDVGGRTVMPGLIDCHAHIDSANMHPFQTLPRTLTVAMALHDLHASLMRGFTTLRDVGGADGGFKDALRQGFVTGPRLFVACDTISQTGGHGDLRPAGCDGIVTGAGMAIADGADEVRRVVRDNLRRGADHIKLMVSGGIASPTDSLEGEQYSVAEIEVAVEEARRGGVYVTAHAYSDDAVHRAVTCGVRTIEHGSLMGERAAKTMAAAASILVPTLSPYHWAGGRGVEFGLSDEHIERARLSRERAFEAIELARRHGVRLALGTDLFRVSKTMQAYELVLRAQIEPVTDVLRSATLGGAHVVGLDGEIGAVEPGYVADLLVVDGDPLSDLGVLQDEGQHLAMIVRAGEIVKDVIGPGLEPR